MRDCQALAGLVAFALATLPAFSAEPPAPDFVPTIAKEAAAEGNVAFARKDFATARRAYERVLELAPDNLLGLVNLGVVEFTAGNKERATELLRRAVQIRIETPPAWLTLGIIYMDQERFDEALAALTQAVWLDPRNARARNYLGVVIGRKGWIDGAQSELRRAVELDPEYADAQFNLAAFYLEEKPPAIELARRHYYRAIELGAQTDPDIEKVLNSTPQKQ
ncbi:MAG: tetratricopeptide repeat protein [Terrimicrobiaceae bacterium]|jgi:tetratricopeptide (TPR) repeat protein